MDVEDGAELVILSSTSSFSFPPFEEATQFVSSILEKCLLDCDDFFADEVKDGLTGKKLEVWGCRDRREGDREREIKMLICCSNMSSSAHRFQF